MSNNTWNNNDSALNSNRDNSYDPWLESQINQELFHAEDPLALDLGCGIGSGSALLRRLGFKVVSTDFSPQALLKAKSLGNIDTAFVADAETLASTLSERRFHLILANLSLRYIPKDRLQVTLLALLTSLKEKGQLIARFNHRSDIVVEDDQTGFAEADEILTTFYTIDDLLNICNPILSELKDCRQGENWFYQIKESDSQGLGGAKRVLTLDWRCQR
ncbi:class I SAM-dependent methyltransferase [Pseudoteredinibacter isoporae]|uniref:SAM-dependent methyltransferase n=1 Tax=Pseudoteredinibacter isoporae TaxID=570281 RepID=A0A7X0MVP0_9GAMM|nr:class I SAM-dependent methyltransferase [Pseudoteredinibacter isoporae]MBB6521325.1 SAM-dependent methyltransferase [Pseudoteredinibacter isoporae]NHO86880.1 class I SAM-dependent methyltransferase [Pseudoteredinibacter isoporae]NIB24668.1 class I SAM-dependent methyltransferase [Pseudoteredinibacter isoporae]